MSLRTQKMIVNPLPPPNVALQKYVSPAVQEAEKLKAQVMNKYQPPTISQTLKATGPTMINKIS